MPTPTVSVYWNERRGHYLVEKYAPSPRGGSVALVEPILVDSENFDQLIAGIILACFEAYKNDGFDENQILRESDKEHREFAQKHKKIILSLSSPTQIVIHPMMRYRGGEHLPVKGSKKTIDMVSALNELPHVIREAFSMAV